MFRTFCFSHPQTVPTFEGKFWFLPSIDHLLNPLKVWPHSKSQQLCDRFLVWSFQLLTEWFPSQVAWAQLWGDFLSRKNYQVDHDTPWHDPYRCWLLLRIPILNHLELASWTHKLIATMSDGCRFRHSFESELQVFRKRIWCRGRRSLSILTSWELQSCQCLTLDLPKW